MVIGSHRCRLLPGLLVSSVMSVIPSLPLNRIRDFNASRGVEEESQQMNEPLMCGEVNGRGEEEAPGGVEGHKCWGGRGG